MSNELRREANYKDIVKEILDSDHPQQLVRSLEPTVLYQVVQKIDIDEAAQLILLATDNQRRVLLDLDLWHKDRFIEDNIWGWLELTDATGDISLLQKMLTAIDLNLVAILISKYVQVHTFDDPVDLPPEEGFYTPDKGYTWLKVIIDNGDKVFLLNRLLAILFETNSDIFYQLLAVPFVATQTMLEESAYQNRCRRLAEYGIPDFEGALDLHLPAKLLPLKKEFLNRLDKIINNPPVKDIGLLEKSVNASITVSSLGISPLDDYLKIGQNKVDFFFAKLSYLVNGAIVYFGISLADKETVQLISKSIVGAINIGLEDVMLDSVFKQYNIDQIIEGVGIEDLYRLGLGHLLPLKELAKEVKNLDNILVNAVLDGIKKPLPLIPHFLKENIDHIDALQEKTSLNASLEPINTIFEVKAIKTLLIKFSK